MRAGNGMVGLLSGNLQTNTQNYTWTVIGYPNQRRPNRPATRTQRLETFCGQPLSLKQKDAPMMVARIPLWK